MCQIYHEYFALDKITHRFCRVSDGKNAERRIWRRIIGGENFAAVILSSFLTFTTVHNPTAAGPGLTFGGAPKGEEDDRQKGNHSRNPEHNCPFRHTAGLKITTLIKRDFRYPLDSMGF
jgi:hypothetical protein